MIPYRIRQFHTKNQIAEIYCKNIMQYYYAILLCCNLLVLTNISRNNSGNLELVNVQVQAVIENALYQDIVSYVTGPMQ